MACLPAVRGKQLLAGEQQRSHDVADRRALPARLADGQDGGRREVLVKYVHFLSKIQPETLLLYTTHREGSALFNDALNTFYLRLVIWRQIQHTNTQLYAEFKKNA